MTADLVSFLRARLDEDEQTARGAEIAQWTVEHPKKTFDLAMAKGLDDRPGTWVVTGEDGEYGIADANGVQVAAHIARHDPARVLAEVDAKRRAIAFCERALAAPTNDGGMLHFLVSEMLRSLALPFREHPDYRPEWAPEE